MASTRPRRLGALEIDHVLIAVADLAAAGRELEARHGLASLDGGRHPGWGTANRIVPLGAAYVELVAVVDAPAAARSPFGRWVASAPGGPLGWAVRADDLDAVARRLGLAIVAGERRTRGGELLRWRMAGIEQAAAEPALPFFIEWAAGTRLPGEVPIAHRAGSVELAALHVHGDGGRLTAWLGSHALPVGVRPGPPAVGSVVLATAAGELVLDRAERAATHGYGVR